MEWDAGRVKNLRLTLDLTQMEFAELLGCRQQTISEWEQGVYAPANAYGKLLDQIQVRAPGAFHLPTPVKSQEALPQAPLEEFLEEEERPFDPAID